MQVPWCCLTLDKFGEEFVQKLLLSQEHRHELLPWFQTQVHRSELGRTEGRIGAAKRLVHISVQNERCILRDGHCRWKGYDDPRNEQVDSCLPILNCAGFSPINHDRPACRTKWNKIVRHVLQVHRDYLTRTKRNVADYWDLSPGERGLPRVFAQESRRVWGNARMVRELSNDSTAPCKGYVSSIPK